MPTAKPPILHRTRPRPAVPIDNPTTSPSVSVTWLPIDQLQFSPFSQRVYGNPHETYAQGDLLESITRQGILVPLLVAPSATTQTTTSTQTSSGPWEVISGQRRLACAQALGWDAAPCQLVAVPHGPLRETLILDANRQRRKTFSQMMREADALEILLAPAAQQRSAANLHPNPERRNSDDPAHAEQQPAVTGRTDAVIARRIGLGGKDLYRQARAIWSAAQSEDIRAGNNVRLLDAESKTVHAAYKDLRRRDRFTTGFKPTPYDIWSFRHDRAYGIPHPGSIPPSIVAHALHYYTAPNALVIDPMAGGGVTLDVCQAMGRRCLAYDLAPTRPDITQWDVRNGFPDDALHCDLVFCDPPYHTMLANLYAHESVSNAPLSAWTNFLERLAGHAYAALRSNGHVALLLANQTEKDLPAGHGYIDHAVLGYNALTRAGFLPERRVSCPMSGGYLPQNVQNARRQGRMLGLVRDLLIMRKPGS